VSNVTKNKEEMEQQLQENITFAIWLQVIGQVIEAVNLTKLYTLTDDKVTDIEKGILTGAWVQAIGDIIGAIGTTAEVMTDIPQKESQAQIVAAQGSWINTLGAGIEAVNVTEAIRREVETAPPPPTIFIPGS
jgi:hypothetical protein